MPLISPLLWQGLLRGLSVAAIIGSQRSVSQARWIGPECAGTGRAVSPVYRLESAPGGMSGWHA
jgi:hypothetical protein